MRLEHAERDATYLLVRLRRVRPESQRVKAGRREVLWLATARTATREPARAAR